MTAHQRFIAKFQDLRRRAAEQCLDVPPSICIMGCIDWHDMHEAVRDKWYGTQMSAQLDGRKHFVFENCTIYPCLTMERGIIFGSNFIP